MIRTVLFTTNKYLSCESCVPTDVIFAVSPALVLNAEIDLKGFIYASLTLTQVLPGGSRIYTLDYEDSQLADPNIGIVPTDIYGAFCRGIEEEWIIEQARKGGV